MLDIDVKNDRMVYKKIQKILEHIFSNNGNRIYTFIYNYIF